MNHSALLDLTRIFIQDTGSDRWASADLTKLLNAAQRELQKIIDAAHEWFFCKPQTYAVVSSTDSYEFDLPADCKKVLSAERQVSGGIPIQVQWVDFPRRHYYHTDNLEVRVGFSRPRCYLRREKLGVVAPTSSYTLIVWYLYEIPDLSLSTDVSEIPSHYHDLLAMYAAKLALSSEERPFTHFESEFNEQLARLGTYIELRQEQEPRHVHYIPE